LHSKTVGC